MKATRPDGTVFEGTPEEFAAMESLMLSKLSVHSTATNNGHKAAPKTGNGNPPLWDETSARAFWDSLDPRHKGGQQKKVLQFLIKHGGRSTPDDLKKALDIEDEPGQALAGILANITRNARRETGNNKALVVDWMSDGKGGCYFIPDGVLQLLKDIE